MITKNFTPKNLPLLWCRFEKAGISIAPTKVYFQWEKGCTSHKGRKGGKTQGYNARLDEAFQCVTEQVEKEQGQVEGTKAKNGAFNATQKVRFRGTMDMGNRRWLTEVRPKPKAVRDIRKGKEETDRARKGKVLAKTLVKEVRNLSDKMVVKDKRFVGY